MHLDLVLQLHTERHICSVISDKPKAEMDVAELNILRLLSGLTRRYRIRNEQIRDKVREARLRVFGHVHGTVGILHRR